MDRAERRRFAWDGRARDIELRPFGLPTAALDRLQRAASLELGGFLVGVAPDAEHLHERRNPQAEDVVADDEDLLRRALQYAAR